MSHLDPEWSALIERALQDRRNPWQRVHQRADPDVAEQTLSFADYALAEAATKLDRRG